MRRDDFLATVRQAAQSGRRYRVPQATIAAGAGYVGARGDLCDALAEEVRLVGGHSQVVANWHAAAVALRQLLTHYQPRTALHWEHAALERLCLAELLAEVPVTAFSNRQLTGTAEQVRRETILAADIGISGVDFAIAETGTLVVCARPGQERVVSLVPPIHIAIVARDQILPDLFDLFSQLNNRGIDHLPGNLVLITGPSKTGDIELELTTGIHGPGEWHVIVVRERIVASPTESAGGH